MRDSPSNNALERTVRHRGPRLAAALASWPAAQLGRYAAQSGATRGPVGSLIRARRISSCFACSLLDVLQGLSS